MLALGAGVYLAVGAGVVITGVGMVVGVVVGDPVCLNVIVVGAGVGLVVGV